MMHESIDRLAMLKTRLARIATGERPPRRRIATGHARLDLALGGGFARGRVHELFASEMDDGPSATGFAAMLALLAAGPGEPILWLRTEAAERLGGRLYGSGIIELGGDPDALVLGIAPNAKALL